MRIILVLLTLLQTLPAWSGESIDRSLNVSEPGKLSVRVTAGDVTVKGWDKMEVLISGEIDSDPDQVEIRQDGNDVTIEIEGSKGKFGRHWHGDSSDLEISVPKGTRINASGMSADFTIEEVQGGAKAESASGDVELSGASGPMHIETISGDITVQEGRGKLDLASVSGDIKVKGDSQFVDINTVSGDVDLNLGQVEILEFTSVSGDLEIEFSLTDDGQFEASTVSGDLELEFANRGLHAQFDLETGAGGEIENGISDAKADESFSGSEDLSFSIGKGTASVEIETMSGTIELRN